MPPITLSLETCRSTDPDGDPLVFLYYWGDGTTESGGCRATHTYRTPGKFVAQACVWDNQPGHVVCEDVFVDVL